MQQKLSPGVQRYVDKANELGAKRAKFRAGIRKLKFDTIAVHGTYSVEEAFAGGQGGIIEPIFPSTSQAYRDSDEMEAGLGYLIPTWCYSRIHNPTVFYLEETLALLESYGCKDDASGLCTSSGMAAIKQAVEPLLAKQREGHEEINFVSAAQVYGGTFQLFNVRMRERGAQGALGGRAVGHRVLARAGGRQHALHLRRDAVQPAAGVLRRRGGRRARAQPRHPVHRGRHGRDAGADAPARARRRHRRALADEDRRARAGSRSAAGSSRGTTSRAGTSRTRSRPTTRPG